MNHTPEQDLQPRDATIVNEPDPDDMEFYYIDKQVLQVRTLSERIRLFVLDFYDDKPVDIDMAVGMLEEVLIERGISVQGE